MYGKFSHAVGFDREVTLKVKSWIGPILALYLCRMAKVTPLFSLKKY